VSLDALYVTLRVPDPAAQTALGALARLLGAAAPRGLERGRVWLCAGSWEALDADEGVWHNPNKERLVRWRPGRPGGFGPPGAGERWVLVRERGSRPEARALRLLAERGLDTSGKLLGAQLWRLEFEPGESLDARAAEVAEVRDAAHGLLVNPHSQAFRVCAPPASLDELAARLAELEEEAR